MTPPRLAAAALAALSLSLPAPRARAQAPPPPVAGATRAQPFRDNQDTSPPVAFGPTSGGVALAPAWSYSFSTTPAGIFGEAVSDAAATYAMSSYVRYGATTVSAFSPVSGEKLWTTAVPHAGGMYFAAAGLQLTSVGVLVTHSVAAGWQCLTALNVADGSVAWTLNTTQVFDHVTIDPSGTRILLTDYFEDPNSTYAAGLMFVDAASGAPTANLTTGFSCVAPIVTLDAIVCFCDGAQYADTLCGIAPDLSSWIWKAPAADPSLGAAYFPSTNVLTWTQIGAVGYGSIVTAIVDAQNATRLAGFSIVDGSRTDLFGPAPGTPGVSPPMPWGSSSSPRTVIPVDLSISNTAATAFLSAINVSDSFTLEREAVCDEAVRHGVPGAPRWATCAAAAATASGRRHRCVASGDCDIAAPLLAARSSGHAGRAPQPAALGPRRSLLNELGAGDAERAGGSEGAPLPVSRWPLVAVGLGAGNTCFHAYTIQRYAGQLGFSNSVLGPDNGVDPTVPQRAVLYIHGAAAGGGGDQVEAIGWDGVACAIAGGAGIVGVADNGRFLSLGGVNGLIVSSGLAFDANGALQASVLAGVTGPTSPLPTPSPAPSASPAAAAASSAASAASAAGPVVGSLVGLGLVAGLGFLAWRQRDALKAQWKQFVGGRPPIVSNDELLASAYESGAGGDSVGLSFGGGARSGGGSDVYASL